MHYIYIFFLFFFTNLVAFGTLVIRSGWLQKFSPTIFIVLVGCKCSSNLAVDWVVILKYQYMALLYPSSDDIG